VPYASVVDQLASGVAPHLASPLSTVTVTVTNTGVVTSDYAALLFLVPPSPGVEGAPLKYLAGFERVHVAPGQTQVCGTSVVVCGVVCGCVVSLVWRCAFVGCGLASVYGVCVCAVRVRGLLRAVGQVVSFPIVSFSLAYGGREGHLVSAKGQWTLLVDDASAALVVA
jgi:hypothetical protein